jgi:hypothetical protein
LLCVGKVGRHHSDLGGHLRSFFLRGLLGGGKCSALLKVVLNNEQD